MIVTSQMSNANCWIWQENRWTVTCKKVVFVNLWQTSSQNSFPTTYNTDYNFKKQANAFSLSIDDWALCNSSSSVQGTAPDSPHLRSQCFECRKGKKTMQIIRVYTRSVETTRTHGFTNKDTLLVSAELNIVSGYRFNWKYNLRCCLWVLYIYSMPLS